MVNLSRYFWKNLHPPKKFTRGARDKYQVCKRVPLKRFAACLFILGKADCQPHKVDCQPSKQSKAGCLYKVKFKSSETLVVRLTPL